MNSIKKVVWVKYFNQSFHCVLDVKGNIETNESLSIVTKASQLRLVFKRPKQTYFTEVEYSSVYGILSEILEQYKLR